MQFIKTCKIKVGYFIRKNNHKKPQIAFGIVYDLTFILHCFFVSNMRDLSFFLWTCFLCALLLNIRHKFLRESGTDTRVSWGKIF